MDRHHRCYCSVALAVCALAPLAASAAAEVRFKHHYIDARGPAGEIFSNLVLGDLDGDGLLDVVVGRSPHGDGPQRITWYRNLGAIDAWSDRLVLNDGSDCGCGGVILDVDADGRPDLVEGGWYRNPGNPPDGAEFERHEGFHGGHDTEAADLDGDGRPEIIVYSQHDGPGVYVYKAPDVPGEPWEEIRALAEPEQMMHGRMSGEVHGAISPRGFGDIDGDGDGDIAYCGGWLENVSGDARTWREHRNIDFARDGVWGQAVRSWVEDIDEDGRLDIVQSECDMPEARIAWFRNVRGDGSEWEMHELPNDETPGDFHSLAVADFDLDGDWDIYADEMEHLHVPAERAGRIGMHVWENLDGRGGEWRKHTIVRGLGGHQARAADIDGDGDMDIVTRPYKPQQNANGGRMHVSVLENLARNPDATGPGSGIGPDGAATDPYATRPVTRTAPVRDAAKGLVAHWAFDELDGGVAELDTGHGHIDAAGLDVPGSALTVAAWVRPDAFTGRGHDGRVLSKATGGQEQDHYWMISGWLDGGATRLRFRLKTGTETTTLLAGELELGAWTHVAAVYDGRHMRLYQDGTEVGSVEKTGPVASDPAVPAWIGDNPPEVGSRPFVGAIDEVRIYSRALPPADVATLAAERPE